MNYFDWLSAVARCFALAIAVSRIASAAPPAAEPKPARFECRWAAQPITIDGQSQEAAWRQAQPISGFQVGWLADGPRPARTATEARLLWDAESLYFFADMTDADLYADVAERDGGTWNNDVFELFFKPARERRDYYEFEVSPKNTVLDMYLPSRGSGGYLRWGTAQKFAWQTQVKLRGTLNRWQDRDEGWSVEGRIPWSDFAATGGKPQPGQRWRFTLCRYDYSIDFEDPELSATARLTRPNFHRYEDYDELTFVGPNKQGQ